MSRLLWLVRRRCPFCQRPGERCVVCGGTGSPLISAGVPIPGVRDREGVDFPLAGAPDMGAFQTFSPPAGPGGPDIPVTGGRRGGHLRSGVRRGALSFGVRG